MIINYQSSFVEIHLEEIIPEHLPSAGDVNCSIKASSEEFSGYVQDIWFSREDINLFLKELQDLEENRRGRVCLKDLSYASDSNPFRFEIFSIDEVGHFALRVDLLKSKYTFNDALPLKLSICFVIDAGLLPSLLIEFRKLFSPTRH